MTDSTHLKLPYILPGQAQKHITHNEAITALDTLTQLAVLDRDLNTPPGTPNVNMRYIVGPTPTGDWAGKANQVTTWDGAAWRFHLPEPGWLAFVLDENGLLAWSGTAWLPTLGLDGQAPMLGVNATPDTANRLAVASDAVLFTHASADVQLKLNKHSSGDTASVVFQTGHSGRAELGTTGDDKFHLKVSADGATWTEALVVDPATGNVGVGGASPAARLDVDGTIKLKSYTLSTLPPATTPGQLAYVSDETGGPILAFSDGTDWRRVTDRAVVG
jgi:hypothetical protein